LTKSDALPYQIDSMSSPAYDWEAEYGSDPFQNYTKDPQEKQELVALIPKFIAAAVDHPTDPLEPNLPLIALAKQLKDNHSQALNIVFYMVAALPDPLEMEAARLRAIQRRHDEATAAAEFAALTPEQRVAKSLATHKGHYQWHDDDCKCAMYFDNTYCNKNGYCWSCCGQTSEFCSCI
jgi:hypothetical protein